MEYYRINFGRKWIYLGNNTRVEARGIDTCKLFLCDSHTLFLCDVLYAIKIRQNLVSISLLKLMRLILNFIIIGISYLLDDFTILDTNFFGHNNNDGYFSLLHLIILLLALVTVENSPIIF